MCSLVPRRSPGVYRKWICLSKFYVACYPRVSVNFVSRSSEKAHLKSFRDSYQLRDLKIAASFLY